MELSSDVFIDFGLNLAGYIVAALMLYILTGRRRRRHSEELHGEGRGNARAASSSRPENVIVREPAESEPEFIALAGDRRPAAEGAVGTGRSRMPTSVRATRQENRRAIYHEARRLLASGTAHSEVLDQLPLTEGELELLSVAGKA